MMDCLDSGTIESMKDLAAAAARRMLSESAGVVFVDCTTLHFESVDEDGLSEFGFSKNGRNVETQALLALMVTSDGLPVSYEVFPESECEVKSVIPSLERMMERVGIKTAIHVADQDLFGEGNLEDMEARGLQYIAGIQLKSLPMELKERILDLESYRPISGSEDLRSTELEHKGRRIIVGWSRKRAKRAAAYRKRAVNTLIWKLDHSTNPARTRSGRVSGQFVKITEDARPEVDEEKINEAARWDGLKGIVTNAPDMAHSELLARCQDPWRVEENFRITKHDLKVRPVFHWKPERVKAHIAIAFMAFACVRHLTYRTALQEEEQMSPETIRTALAARQCSIMRDIRSGRRYALPSKATPDMERICRILELPLSRAPYWIE